MSNPVIITIGDFRVTQKNAMNLEIEKKETAKLSRNPEIAAKQLADGGLESKWNDGHGFYGDLGQALVKIHRQTINSVQADTVENLIEEIKSSEQAIKDKVAEMEYPEQLTRDDIEDLKDLNKEVKDPRLTDLLQRLTEED